MAEFNDAMYVEAKGVILKKRWNGKRSMDEIEARITASVEAGLLRIEAPAADINISFRLQDVLAVIQASNAKYLDNKK
jgi:hypothetical protein